MKSVVTFKSCIFHTQTVTEVAHKLMMIHYVLACTTRINLISAVICSDEIFSFLCAAAQNTERQMSLCIIVE